MKQAIQEGFILDVLKNYLPYDLAFEIAHKDDPAKLDVEVDTQKANGELMRRVRLHPTPALWIGHRRRARDPPPPSMT